MHPALRGYCAAVLESAREAGTLDQVADELRQVEEFVARTGTLEAALTDAAVPAPARRALIAELFGTRLRPETTRLVIRASADERPDEFPIGLHDLTEQAHLVASAVPEEDVEAEEPVLGRTPARQWAAGYAAAVFESLGSVAELEDVEDELFRFARIVESSPELRSTLSDPSRPAADRKALVAALLSGRSQAATLRLAQAALQGRVRDVVHMLDWLVERAAEARGWRVARVRAARDVDEAERRQLDEALERVTGTPVELQVTVEPELLGGIVVQVGDLLVDASARHRLEQLQEHLLGLEGATRGAGT
ncbi:MAG TPA: ATP synthase F1 subunit delta [Acidimicrobiales bacterium]|nr:ATP synthase F1 subunit delta [Acidimicrobiales bacterium]